MNLSTGSQLAFPQCPSLLGLCVHIALFHSSHSVPPVQPSCLVSCVTLPSDLAHGKTACPFLWKAAQGTGKVNITRCKLKLIILGSWFVLSAATSTPKDLPVFLHFHSVGQVRKQDFSASFKKGAAPIVGKSFLSGCVSKHNSQCCQKKECHPFFTEVS